MFELHTKNAAIQVSKTAMSLKKITLLLAFMLPAVVSGQEQRPALIPLQQAGPPGAGATASSSAGIGGLTDEPISAGEVVHISVFDAPDFSVTARVSESGDVPYRFLVGAKLRELELAVHKASSDQEVLREITRLTGQSVQSN